MISLRITPESTNRLYAEINNKIEGTKELTTVRTKNQLMNTAFSLSSLKFIKQTNAMGRSAKKRLHHVYEWGGVGKESGRLFRLIKKQASGGNASVYYRFNNSKKMSPIARSLKVPGPTGKIVKTSGIFKKKAEVMESGRPVSFITKRHIAFSSGNGIVFIPPGKTISIKSPGGNETTGSFEEHFRTWWMINFPTSLDSAGIPQKLERNIARALNPNNAGKSSARYAIETTLGQYQMIGSVI
jgi:hypothetical protein